MSSSLTWASRSRRARARVASAVRYGALEHEHDAIRERFDQRDVVGLVDADPTAPV